MIRSGQSASQLNLHHLFFNHVYICVSEDIPHRVLVHTEVRGVRSLKIKLQVYVTVTLCIDACSHVYVGVLVCVYVCVETKGYSQVSLTP